MKRSPNKYRRGDADHYRKLQAKSMENRIARHIEVPVLLDNQRVTSLPVRKRQDDAGFDIASCDSATIYPDETVTVATGIRVRCPSGYGYLLLGRSSLNQRGIDVGVSVIDAGYTGELKVRLRNNSDTPYEIRVGDRVAQLLFFPQIHATLTGVDAFEGETDRGDQGWGSTGK